MPSLRIDAGSVAAYAEGCAILGTGGGGDIRVPLLIARAALADGPVEVVSPDALADEAGLRSLRARLTSIAEGHSQDSDGR